MRSLSDARCPMLRLEPLRMSATLWIIGRRPNSISRPVQRETFSTRQWTFACQPETCAPTLRAQNHCVSE